MSESKHNLQEFYLAWVHESNPCTAKMGAKQTQGRTLSRLEETHGNTHRVQLGKSDIIWVRQTYISQVDNDHDASKGIETPLP